MLNSTNKLIISNKTIQVNVNMKYNKGDKTIFFNNPTYLGTVKIISQGKKVFIISSAQTEYDNKK